MLGKLVRCAATCSAAGLLAVAGATAVSAVDPVPPGADGVTDTLASPPLSTDDVTPVSPDGGRSEPGSAAATGLGVAPLGVCVACTSAGSTPGAGHAQATAVRVLGVDVAGGRSSGDGAHSGALLATPANPLLNLALGQWAADSRSAGSSHSKSALIAFVILPAGQDEGGTATVCVVDTSSDSSERGRKSKGSGEVADADVAGGSAAARVAHSEASQDGDGKAYVVGVNKNELISSDQSREGLPVKIPGADVVVVHKRASDADTEAAVAAAEAQQGSPSDTAPTADAVVASAASPARTAAAPTTAVQTPATGSGALPSASVGGTAVSVPSTGTELGIGGLLLVLCGAGLAVISLRRRSAGG